MSIYAVTIVLPKEERERLPKEERADLMDCFYFKVMLGIIQL
ncbi:hypothetical protein [Veillonella montpellierensis]|nr:hypothetical protein [Veillonella montpellierensis]